MYYLRGGKIISGKKKKINENIMKNNSVCFMNQIFLVLNEPEIPKGKIKIFRKKNPCSNFIFRKYFPIYVEMDINNVLLIRK